MYLNVKVSPTPETGEQKWQKCYCVEKFENSHIPGLSMPRLLPTEKKMHSSPYDYPPPGYSPYYYPPIVFPQPFEHSQGFHHYSMPDTRPIHPPPIVPHENDVLMGRGGKNNQHSGNEKLRQIARQYSDKYRTSTKKEKSNLSRELVKQMRKLNPPARFLRKDPETSYWEEVGDDTAREKTSQVLRDAVTAMTDEPSEQAQILSGVPSAVFSGESINVTPVREKRPCPIANIEHTPTLESLDSFPPGYPSSRKRSRFSVGHPSGQSANSFQPESSPIVRRNGYRHQISMRRDISSLRAPSHDTSAPGDSHTGTISEFDLLHGELLESDPEDNAEPFSHGVSHAHLF